MDKKDDIKNYINKENLKEFYKFIEMLYAKNDYVKSLELRIVDLENLVKKMKS